MSWCCSQLILVQNVMFHSNFNSDHFLQVQNRNRFVSSSYTKMDTNMAATEWEIITAIYWEGRLKNNKLTNPNCDLWQFFTKPPPKSTANNTVLASETAHENMSFSAAPRASANKHNHVQGCCPESYGKTNKNQKESSKCAPLCQGMESSYVTCQESVLSFLQACNTADQVVTFLAFLKEIYAFFLNVPFLRCVICVLVLFKDL